MDTNVRIAGEAGQGVETIGTLTVDALAGMGLCVFATRSYMSRIRGGLNAYDIRIGDRELFSRRDDANVLVALTQAALERFGPDVAGDGVVLFDGRGGPNVVSIPFSAAAKELTGSTIMANTVACGALFTVLGCGIEELSRRLEAEFSDKGPEAVEQNLKCARRGAELARPHAGRVRVPKPCGTPASVYDGSEAVGLGAATAGVRFATAYPMTPATAAFTYLAHAADEYGIVVEQAEDEIAAINMVCGAAYAGVPAMTTTSGGGFALMCEGLSLAGMLELPVLVMLAQRPGPATGLPTRTAQQDLRFALSGGHGEFPRALYAPGTPLQAYELTRRALETAHRFQSPAILLTDQFLADQRKNMPELDRTARPVCRHVLKDPPEDYVRYAVTQDGVSPRALPGSAAFVVCDSDEHTEDGHITEDLGARVRLQDKRARKAKAMQAEALPPELYGPPDADLVLLAWGSTYGPCREAVDLLGARGTRAAMVHFAQLWPLNVEAARPLLDRSGTGSGRSARIVSVEGNATGQLALLLRETGVLGECELMLRYDGLPFTAEEIARRASE